jgi:hypothetical protein
MLDSNLTEWSEVANLTTPNCTIWFEVPDGSTTYHPVSGNSEFAQREISIRAHVYEGDSLGNRGVKDTSIGVDSPDKQLTAIVKSVSDTLNPSLPNNLLPPSVSDFAPCRLEFDYPAGLKRTGKGTIRLEQLDEYSLWDAIGELFYIRFTPDRARRA